MNTPNEPQTITAATPLKAGRPVVMQVLPSLETGGVERGTVDMAKAITDAGWGSVVVSSGGAMVREILRAGGVHVTLPVDSKNPLVMRANVRRLARVIEEHGVGIVHARSRAPAWSARAAAQRTDAHFVTTFHGAYSLSGPLKRRYNAIMGRGERVIAISNYIADMLIGVYGVDPERIRVIHRGIDTDIFNIDAVSPERLIQLTNQWRLHDAVPVIMLPGRLTRWKGHTVLIDALARLQTRNVRCLFVGSDQGRTEYRQEIERRANRAGVGGILQIVGHCRDMPAAYLLADVVVSASTDAEAFGRIAVEAQAMGRPVIASNLGAANETVLDGKTGLLVPPDDPQALADALTQVLALGATEREILSDQAVEHVRSRFTRKMMCDRTLEVYDEVLRGSRTGARQAA